MDYLIALIAMPILMVVWVVVQRWAADDPEEDSIGGRCDGCTCGLDSASCDRREREAMHASGRR